MTNTYNYIEWITDGPWTQTWIAVVGIDSCSESDF